LYRVPSAVIAADHLVQDRQVPRIHHVLVVLEPVAVAHVADRVISPDAHSLERHVLAITRVVDVVHGEERLLVRRPHVHEYQAAELVRRVGGMLDVLLAAEIRRLARHFAHPAFGIEQPAVIAAADSLLLDATPFERSSAMAAMQFEAADLAQTAAEQHQVLAKNAYSPGQVLELLGEGDGLPVAAQQLAHGRAGFYVGEGVIFGRDLPAIA
jgi:hypothetical protein